MTGRAVLPLAGRFIVDTESDTYDIDVDSRLVIWHDMAREAAGFHTEPEVFMFDTVECETGRAMVFDAGSWPRVTPRVVGITPVTHSAEVPS